MARQRIDKELRKPSDYNYDFPENRELAKGLLNGDYELLANSTGYTKSYLKKIFGGTRRMPEVVMETANIIIAINNEKKDLLKSIVK